MQSWREYMAEKERDYFAQLMPFCGGKVSKAAQVSGFSRTHLYVVLKLVGQGRDRCYGNAAWRELRL